MLNVQAPRGENFVFLVAERKMLFSQSSYIWSDNILDKGSHLLGNLSPLLLGLDAPLAHFCNIAVRVLDESRQHSFQSIHSFFEIGIWHTTSLVANHGLASRTAPITQTPNR